MYPGNGLPLLESVQFCSLQVTYSASAHTKTHTGTHQAEASAVVLTNEERQSSPTANWPLLPSCTARVTKLVPVREELRGGEDRSPQRPIAFFAFNHGAGGEPVLAR